MPTTAQTVREIALQQPTAIRVFEHFKIDYCCGGRKPLGEACAAENIDVETVIAALEAAGRTAEEAAEDWASASLSGLCAHIVGTHHAYVRRELPRLTALAQKVVSRHGETHPELPAIQATLGQLAEELTQHLAKEELVLFPYVTKLEQAVVDHKAKPHPCFGAVANPIAMMTQEHESAGTMLAVIRLRSDGFTAPENACPTYRAFYSGLQEFEQDLHQHIHLENNILFPRAIELEESSARRQ